ncbi:MAG: AIR synthase related protein, partial [Thermoproteota archaeon]
MGLGISLERMRYLKQYFKERPPTDVELQMIGQTWSEHCFHNVFKGDVITDDGRLINSILKTYIMRSTKELDKDWCISVFEDNAGIIDFDKGYAVAAKVETHNHPSAVEPFGGAATGVGGVIRDILGVWGEPVALTDVLCFGPLETRYDELPPGVKHPRYLYRGV